MHLKYIGSDENIAKTANHIREVLAQSGIDLSIEAVPLQSLSSLEKDSYDVFLAGTDLGYFSHNIFPYFHSSQVQQGYNLSNFKKLSLDLLLEELKENTFSPEKTQELQEKVLKILKEEQIVKTLYRPLSLSRVDKKIHGYQLETSLVNEANRHQSLGNIYINQEKVLSLSEKSFAGFVKFLFNF